MRDSNIKYFAGQTITSTDWTEIYETPDLNLKYQRFNESVFAMMNYFFPNEPTSDRKSDKPWLRHRLSPL